VALVVCSSADLSALWAYRGLRAQGFGSLELITGEMLALSTCWEHRLGASGMSTAFTLAEGRRIASGEISGVLNRLVAPPEALIAQSVPADREYIQQELTALYLSWLNALSVPVVNRPTPQGLAGRWRHTAEWAIVADEAGFSVPVYRQTGHDGPERGYASLAPAAALLTQVIVFDGDTFGATVPDAVRARCVRLAELSGTEMLGVDLFATPGDHWTFACATPLPDLQIGRDALLQRLGRIIANGGIGNGGQA
jgi:hypothetical protein